MRTSIVSLALVFVLAAATAAQSVFSYDLTGLRERLGWVTMNKPVPVETDGNPWTQEFIVSPIFDTARRVVSPALCVSVEFHVGYDWTLDTIGGRSKYTRMNGSHYEIMDLPSPVCD